MLGMGSLAQPPVRKELHQQSQWETSELAHLGKLHSSALGVQAPFKVPRITNEGRGKMREDNLPPNQSGEEGSLVRDHHSHT